MYINDHVICERKTYIANHYHITLLGHFFQLEKDYVVMAIALISVATLVASHRLQSHLTHQLGVRLVIIRLSPINLPITFIF